MVMSDGEEKFAVEWGCIIEESFLSKGCLIWDFEDK